MQLFFIFFVLLKINLISKIAMKLVFNPIILKFCLLGVLDRFMLIYSVYIMFFAKIGLTPALVGMVLAFYEFGKIFGDPIFSILADKYGRKMLIIIGFLFKAFGVLTWVLYPSITTAFIGVFFIGSGKSGTNNIDSYMYDEFKNNKLDSKFKDVIAMKSIFTNISASIGGFFTSFLYKFGGFNAVFLSSVIIIMCVSIPYISFFLKDSKTYTKANKKLSMFEIAKEGFSYAKTNSRIFYGVILSAIFYSVYIIMTDTNKMVMNDIGFTPDFIARVYAIAHIIPAITTFIFIVIQPGLLIRGVVLISIIMWISIAVVSSTFYGKPLVTSILMFLFMFPIFDTCIKDNLHRMIANSSFRSTILSFSHLISSFLNIFLSLLIGFVADQYSYKYSMVLFPILISVLTFIVMVLQQKRTYKLKNKIS